MKSTSAEAGCGRDQLLSAAADSTAPVEDRGRADAAALVSDRHRRPTVGRDGGEGSGVSSSGAISRSTGTSSPERPAGTAAARPVGAAASDSTEARAAARADGATAGRSAGAGRHTGPAPTRHTGPVPRPQRTAPLGPRTERRRGSPAADRPGTGRQQSARRRQQSWNCRASGRRRNWNR